MARADVVKTGQQVLSDAGVLPQEDDSVDNQDQPGYVLAGSASVPVSLKAGSRWKDKIDNAMTAYDSTRKSWVSAFNSYRACNNSDVNSLAGEPGVTGNYFANQTDENLTRETVKTVLRTSYTNNPTVNIVSVNEADDAMVNMLKAVANTLLNRKYAPGLNGKSRVKRWIVHGHLTNFGVTKLDYQGLEGSRAEAFANLTRLQEEASKEKDLRKLEDIYGELAIAEEELSTTRDPGMILSNVQALQLIIDPDTTYLDLSDCKWTDEIILLDDSYIRKRFLKKDEDGAWVRITDGKAPGGTITGEGNNVNDIRDTIVEKIMGPTSESISQARAKGKSQCHLIRDRLTKQTSLWLDGSWDYPLYVWEDDLKLSRYFPYFIMAFTEPTDAVVQEGEQAQYSGQEKEINKINKRVAFIRRLAYGQVIYNTRKMKVEEAKKIVDHMKNPEEFDALGVDWDPEQKLSDMFDLFVPPDGKIQELYDKSDLYKVANRVNAQSAAAQGEQYKTNTTNKAIAAYQSVDASVKDELAEVIEDALGDLVWAMLEIVVSKYSKDQVTQLIGEALAAPFENMPVDQFNQQYSCEIAGGTTQRPTSDNQKQEALSMAQAIGQVGQAAPQTTLKIIFRMFQKAFSQFVYGPQDVAEMSQEIQVNATKGQSVPGQPPGNNALPATGAVAPKA
jgi:hypothetical protein